MSFLNGCWCPPTLESSWVTNGITWYTSSPTPFCSRLDVSEWSTFHGFDFVSPPAPRRARPGGSPQKCKKLHELLVKDPKGVPRCRQGHVKVSFKSFNISAHHPRTGKKDVRNSPYKTSTKQHDYHEKFLLLGRFRSFVWRCGRRKVLFFLLLIGMASWKCC